MPLDARCQYCGAPLKWARRKGTGKLDAFDAEPGQYLLQEQPDGSTVATLETARRFRPHACISGG